MTPHEHLVMVDAGDFLGGDSDQDALKGEFLVRGLRQLGMGAMNLGEMDFSQGQAYLRHLEQDLGAPFVSANICWRDSGEPFVAPYRILRVGGRRFLGREWGGLRLGVFGLASNEFPPRASRPEDRPLVVLDPAETARRVVAELRPRCDLVVALSHLGLPRSEQLASTVPGIDILVSGHGRLRLDGYRRVGQTVVVHSRSEGKFVADLALTVDDHARITQVQAVQITLDEQIPEEADVAALYQQYHAELRAHRAPRPSGPPRYAGALACARCHQPQYQQWSGTAHARALESLSERAEDHNPECLPCHATGFAEPGGFYDPASTPALAGVQCESCHGAAVEHVRDAGSGARGRRPLPQEATASCVRCHDEKNDPDFDLRQAAPLVAH